MYRIQATSTQTVDYNFAQDIVIESGGVLTMVATTGGVQVDVNLFVYETNL